jgi:hypothetical protein
MVWITHKDSVTVEFISVYIFLTLLFIRPLLSNVSSKDSQKIFTIGRGIRDILVFTPVIRI